MTREEWKNVYGKTPERFCASMRSALDCKRDPHKERRLGFRTIAVALTLALLFGCAGAAGNYGIKEFLGNKELGEINVVQPELTVIIPMRKIDVQIREAACDGISAHIVLAFTVKDENDAIITGTGQAFEDAFVFPFEDERKAAENVYSISIGKMKIEELDEQLRQGNLWEYESAQTVLMDYIIDFRDEDGSPAELPDSLTVQCYQRYSIEDKERKERTIYNGEFQLTIPVQRANQRIYEAQNVPFEVYDEYTVNAVTVIETDLACYLNADVEHMIPNSNKEDNYGCMIWVQDQAGESVHMLKGGDRGYTIEDREDYRRYMIVNMFERFDIGDTLQLKFGKLALLEPRSDASVALIMKKVDEK